MDKEGMEGERSGRARERVRMETVSSDQQG